MKILISNFSATILVQSMKEIPLGVMSISHPGSKVGQKPARPQETWPDYFRDLIFFGKSS